MLSDRKKKILQAVIDENIKSAEPVSSKDLQQNYLSSISSATIRNELMALEEMGYLTHPHTSSGRVPTSVGFQKYIEELMPDRTLTNEEIEEVKKSFDKKIASIEELAFLTAKSISKSTNYASVVMLGVLPEAIINSINLIRVDKGSALAIIVTDLGVIKDLFIEIPRLDEEEDLLVVSKMLTNVFGGKSLIEIGNLETITELLEETNKYKQFFEVFISAVKEHNKQAEKVVKIDGTAKLLNQPEYKSIEKAQKALSLFENKEILSPLVESGNDLEISIKVGADDNQDCSVVSATYKINGKPIGKASVVGPVRMDYAKAVSILKEVNHTIEQKVQINSYGKLENKKETAPEEINKSKKEEKNGKQTKR